MDDKGQAAGSACFNGESSKGVRSAHAWKWSIPTCRQSTQWGKGETTSKHVPARRDQAPVSFLPTWEKAGCLSKAAFRKGQAGWRGAAPIHGGNKQKQGQPLWL